MGCCKCCCISLLVVAIVIGISTGLFAGLFPYPSHASCKVDWDFGKSCGVVKSALTKQIKEWSDVSCTGKQQCGYEFIGSDGNAIKGRRVTPVLRYVDNFNFTFTSKSSGCFVVGHSSSESWYAIIDFGYNYCNLKNLIMGSRMDENDPYYAEHSANGICTMYSIAHCNLY